MDDQTGQLSKRQGISWESWELLLKIVVAIILSFRYTIQNDWSTVQQQRQQFETYLLRLQGVFLFLIITKSQKKEGVKEKMFLFITITTFNDNLTKKAISCGSALLPPPPFLFFENFIDLEQCFSTDGLSNISQCINGAIKEHFVNKNLLNTECSFNKLLIF